MKSVKILIVALFLAFWVPSLEASEAWNTIWKLIFPGTNFCGASGGGESTNRVDKGCQAHDKIYTQLGVGSEHYFETTDPQVQVADRLLLEEMEKVAGDPTSSSLEKFQAEAIRKWFVDKEKRNALFSGDSERTGKIKKFISASRLSLSELKSVLRILKDAALVKSGFFEFTSKDPAAFFGGKTKASDYFTNALGKLLVKLIHPTCEHYETTLIKKKEGDEKLYKFRTSYQGWLKSHTCDWEITFSNADRITAVRIVEDSSIVESGKIFNNLQTQIIPALSGFWANRQEYLRKLKENLR